MRNREFGSNVAAAGAADRFAPGVLRVCSASWIGVVTARQISTLVPVEDAGATRYSCTSSDPRACYSVDMTHDTLRLAASLLERVARSRGLGHNQRLGGSAALWCMMTIRIPNSAFMRCLVYCNLPPA